MLILVPLGSSVLDSYRVRLLEQEPVTFAYTFILAPRPCIC